MSEKPFELLSLCHFVLRGELVSDVDLGIRSRDFKPKTLLCVTNKESLYPDELKKIVLTLKRPEVRDELKRYLNDEGKFQIIFGEGVITFKTYSSNLKIELTGTHGTKNFRENNITIINVDLDEVEEWEIPS